MGVSLKTEKRRSQQTSLVRLAAPHVHGLPRSLFVLCFERDPHDLCLWRFQKAKMTRRINIDTRRGRRFEIEVDGQKLSAYEGETIAAVLLAAGIRVCRLTPKKHRPAGIYCGIGLCHECVMVVNGVPNTRTCQTLASPGCRVETQKGLGEIEKVERS